MKPYYRRHHRFGIPASASHALMGEAVLHIIEGCKGLTFVGDPHLTSRRPGSRQDEDFPGTVLDKIDQGARHAVEKDHHLFFLGDLYHSDRENDLRTICRLEALLVRWRDVEHLEGHGKTFPEEALDWGLEMVAPVATIGGNHERSEATTLTDGVAVAISCVSRNLICADTSAIHFLFPMTDASGRAINVWVGTTPHGIDLPAKVTLPKIGVRRQIAKSVSSMDPDAPDVVIWLTHHDLAFDKSYPGATQPPCIEGVHVLINGHVHQTTPSLQVGTMHAFNPGNITRLSVDTRNHRPAVWDLDPFSMLSEGGHIDSKLAALTPHYLKVAPPEEVFTELRFKAGDVKPLKEHQLEAIVPLASQGGASDKTKSTMEFVQALAKMSSAPATSNVAENLITGAAPLSLTSDAHYLRKVTEIHCKELGLDDDFAASMLALTQRSVDALSNK